MQISELMQQYPEILGKKVEIEGVAEVSNTFSLIYDKADRDHQRPRAPVVLIHGQTLLQVIESLNSPPPIMVGSEVLFVVDVRIVGVVTHTGYQFAPLKFAQIYTVDVTTGRSVEHVMLDSPLVDISFELTRSLTATEVTWLASYFPDYPNLLALKHALENGQSIRLVERVEQAELQRHLQVLERIEAKYVVHESAVYEGH